MTAPSSKFELAPQTLRRVCDPSLLDVPSEPSAPRSSVLGQGRAVDAIDLALEMNQRGYNLFVVGPVGSGRSAAVRGRVAQAVKSRPVPPDLCYVMNFEEPRRPRLLTLPAGQAQRLRTFMTKLVQELRGTLVASFESQSHREQCDALRRETSQRVERELAPVREYAQAHDIAIVPRPSGFELAPMKNGELFDPTAPDAHMSDAEQARIEAASEEVRKRLFNVLNRMPPIHRAQHAKERELERAAAGGAVRELLSEARRGFGGCESVEAYLDAVERDIVEHCAEIMRLDEEPMSGFSWIDPGDTRGAESRILRRYRVNIVVDHALSDAAPVIVVENASALHLIGRVEHFSQLGLLVTDFSLIKAGALHQANGGYLIIDAHQLFTQPFAWEQLKRTLRTAEIRIEPVFDALGVLSSVSQEPDPVPLDLKVVLIGDRSLYDALVNADPEFEALFKIVADFEDSMPRDAAGCREYARLLVDQLRGDTSRRPSQACLARLLEESARSAEDAGRLDLRLGPQLDLLREADLHAARAHRDTIEIDDLEGALRARQQRHGRLRDVMRAQIREGIVRVETSGQRVGQINALSVIPLARGSFGIPSRVSARVRLGKGEVVDIEREVRMAGPSHSKGVLILGACLGGLYLVDRALSLRASLVFEQTYGFVDGDSASLAELLALLSAIAEVPLPQQLAVTGSIDQHGAVQAVGGLHEKIEGFFETCALHPLTGTQGVIIPRACAAQLMLQDEVVQAARAGAFHVYAVEHVDQALEVMLGASPGARGEDGRFAPDSFHDRVERRLERFARMESTGKPESGQR